VKENRPSRTAAFVTLGRAMAHLGLSHVPGFSDPTARVLLTDKGKESLAKIERAIQAGQTGMRIGMARGMADMMALRTTAIDVAVRDAIAGGATQLVILGAGYDGRAWRMPELRGVKVFEVDHPATQGDKRRHLTELPPAFGEVTFVPVNFERDSLGTALDRAGHDRLSRTCWIWEGVVMYLTREAMSATLASISARSASGSTVIINYHSANRRFLARLIFRLIGEPMISAWSPDQMAAELAATGFTVHEDSGMLDWNAKYANGAGVADRGKFLRIVTARKK
jgi:methyltransferase (TIGR00027 family)